MINGTPETQFGCKGKWFPAQRVLNRKSLFTVPSLYFCAPLSHQHVFSCHLWAPVSLLLHSFHLSFVVLLIFGFSSFTDVFFPILFYFISVCSLYSCPVQPNLVLPFIVASFTFHTLLSLCSCQSRSCCLLYCVIICVTHVKNRVAKLLLWHKYILVRGATNQLMKPNCFKLLFYWTPNSEHKEK